MEWIDYIVIAVVLVILGAAGWYIYRSKRSGKKCIGCPDSGTCSGNCANCGCAKK